MSTTATNTNPLSTTPAKPRRKKPGRAVVMSNIPWGTYLRLLKAFAEKPAIRMTYDDEELEIMVPSLDHDFSDRILAALIPILAEEFRLMLRPGGATTLKRKRNLKGIEGDDVFWIANAAKMAGVRKLDLRIHPAPDLAIEVDVSRSSMDRLKIYAKLGVPEVWRLEGDELTFHVLSGNHYTLSSKSRSFPLVAPGDLMPFISLARASGDQLPVYHAFREWVRQLIAASAAPPPPAPGS